MLFLVYTKLRESVDLLFDFSCQNTRIQRAKKKREGKGERDREREKGISFSEYIETCAIFSKPG